MPSRGGNGKVLPSKATDLLTNVFLRLDGKEPPLKTIEVSKREWGTGNS